MNKRHKLLSAHYQYVLIRMQTCSDKQFPKWLKLSKIIKEEIIALELTCNQQ